MLDSEIEIVINHQLHISFVLHPTSKHPFSHFLSISAKTKSNLCRVGVKRKQPAV